MVPVSLGLDYLLEGIPARKSTFSSSQHQLGDVRSQLSYFRAAGGLESFLSLVFVFFGCNIAGMDILPGI
jgi:hypothetical protein